MFLRKRSNAIGISLIPFLFAFQAFADPSGPELDFVAKLKAVDAPFADLLTGKLTDQIILCQGLDYPVSFSLEHAGETDLLNLNVSLDGRQVISGMKVGIDLIDSSADKNSLNLRLVQVVSNSGETFQIGFDLFGKNDRYQKHGISHDAHRNREGGIVGTVSETGQIVHSFHSVCGFYLKETDAVEAVH